MEHTAFLIPKDDDLRCNSVDSKDPNRVDDLRCFSTDSSSPSGDESKGFIMEWDSLNLVWRNKRQSLLYRTFYEEISKEKTEIDKLNNHEVWDKMKKVGNPYELIYTTYHRKRKNDSISKYIPLSRSYFKMWEIYHNFPIFSQFPINTSFHCAHLAEGPGGFMEATANYIKYIRSKSGCEEKCGDQFVGITLKPHNEHIPDWVKIKKVFGNQTEIEVNYGNLYIYEDVCEYVSKFKTRRAHIVSADGGFDYSADFNGQELNSTQIIYSEIAIALNILIKGGSFVCKVFDLFSVSMVKMVELLNRHFERVYIYKPETSRPANSEKYIVCLHFLDNMSAFYKEHLLKQIEVWNQMASENREDQFIDIEKIRVPSYLVHALYDYNKEYIEHQKKYLKSTIQIAKNNPTSMIEKEDYEKILRSQVENAYTWCKKYDVPINYESMYWRKYSHTL